MHLPVSARLEAILSLLLPCDALAVLSAAECEALLAGSSDVDVAALRAAAVYERGASAQDAHVRWLWEVLAEARPEDRVAFLRFVTARSRLPPGAALGAPFKIAGPSGAAEQQPDRFLPQSQTCFNVLLLPRYSSKRVLRERLLLSVHHAQSIDGDFASHAPTAVGWGDV